MLYTSQTTLNAQSVKPDIKRGQKKKRYGEFEPEGRNITFPRTVIVQQIYKYDYDNWQRKLKNYFNSKIIS